jgi:hypothetical protein
MGAPLHMKLRDQLRANKGTFYDWPPIWTNCQDPTDKPQGEIGNLQEVMMTEADDDILFIAIEYQGRRYIGAMGFDSPDLCFQISILLQSHIGLSIKDIGDLDLP